MFDIDIRRLFSDDDILKDFSEIQIFNLCLKTVFFELQVCNGIATPIHTQGKFKDRYFNLFIDYQDYKLLLSTLQ